MSSGAEASEALGISRRDALKTGAAAILRAEAASDPVKYGAIGLGSRGAFLAERLARLNGARCAALCDVSQQAMDAAAKRLASAAKKYKDYRELLADKDVDAVTIATPSHLHFGMTRDALLAGKHVFCEPSLAFKAEELHALRRLAAEHPKQVLQTGLQGRYSVYFQAVKRTIAGGMLGTVTHIQGQWNRNPGWTMAAGGKENPANWRLFKEYSGGLAAELAAHYVDAASWFFGAQPEFVTGLGGLDHRKDGRDIFDNIHLIFSYPGGRKLTFSAISTCQHLPMLSSQRPEAGLAILGTGGAVEATLGNDYAPPTALWFREPQPGAQAGPQQGMPVVTAANEVDWTGDAFLTRETKYARQWLLEKGILLAQEDRNPADTELEGFLDCVRGGKRPAADVEIGLASSAAAILANIALEENRRVFFKEIETMGLPAPTPPPVAAKPEDSAAPKSGAPASSSSKKGGGAVIQPAGHPPRSVKPKPPESKPE